MNKRLIIIVVVAVGLVGLTAMKLMSNQEAVKKKIYIHDSEAAVLVEETAPSIHTFESAFSYLGTFEPIRQNTIGSDASGKIIRLNIEEGDRVSQGQVIAKIDDEMLQLQLENAEVNIEGQKNDDIRYTNLAKDNAVPISICVNKLKFQNWKKMVKDAQVFCSVAEATRLAFMDFLRDVYPDLKMERT